MRRSLSGSSVVGLAAPVAAAAAEAEAAASGAAGAGGLGDASASRSPETRAANGPSPETVAARRGKWDAPLLGRRVVVRPSFVGVGARVVLMYKGLGRARAVYKTRAFHAFGIWPE
jgi:hypothetical protein